MKYFRLTNIFLLASLCFLLTACGEKTEDAVSEETTSVETPSNEETEDAVAASSADIDITSFSGTMAYAEISNIQSSPDDYIGKTIRMAGSFATYEENGTTYFLCIVEDAKACCSIGIEFVLEGEHSYPDDYPEMLSDIIITGEIQTYERDGNMYCHLTNAVIE